MADNVPITPGTGAVIATDDVGGVQFQRVKLDIGADGASTPVVGGLPVTGTFWQATQPVSGTVTANLGTVAGLALDATLGTTNTGIGAPADAAWTGTGNASVVAAVKGVWNAITFNSLPAGTNAIGTVTAVGNAASGAADSGNPVKIGAVFNTTLPTVTNGQRVDAQATARGERLVAISNGATAAAVKAASTAAVAADPALVVSVSPNTAVVLGSGSATIGTVAVASQAASASAGGHTSVYTAISAANTTPVQIKATAANLGLLSIRNNSAATRYVKLFFVPSASVTMGTTSPGLNLGVAAGQVLQLPPPTGLRSGTGLTWSVTTGQALLDNTAGAAGDVEINAVFV